MNQRAAVVITNDNKILVIHRLSNGKDYYICPGGSVDDNETIEKAAIRETLEETGLSINLGKKLWQYEHLDFNNRTEHFFAVDKYSGTAKLGGPEALRHSETDSYELVWLSMEQLKDIQFFPEEIKIKILKKLA
jgi:8-oxo-dGTP diphosphatase